MRRYDLLPSAQDDLLDLNAYVSEYSEAAADRLTDEVFDCFEQLAEFPLMGRERSDLRGGLRSFMLNRRRLIVFYYANPDEKDRVLIARVLRQERDTNPKDFGG